MDSECARTVATSQGTYVISTRSNEAAEISRLFAESLQPGVWKLKISLKSFVLVGSLVRFGPMEMHYARVRLTSGELSCHGAER